MGLEGTGYQLRKVVNNQPPPAPELRTNLDLKNQDSVSLYYTCGSWELRWGDGEENQRGVWKLFKREHET